MTRKNYSFRTSNMNNLVKLKEKKFTAAATEYNGPAASGTVGTPSSSFSDGSGGSCFNR